MPWWVAVSTSSPERETSMSKDTADDTKPESTEKFWSALRDAEREADRVARASVMESFQDWAPPESASSNSPPGTLATVPPES